MAEYEGCPKRKCHRLFESKIELKHDKKFCY